MKQGEQNLFENHRQKGRQGLGPPGGTGGRSGRGQSYTVRTYELKRALGGLPLHDTPYYSYMYIYRSEAAFSTSTVTLPVLWFLPPFLSPRPCVSSVLGTSIIYVSVPYMFSSALGLGRVRKLHTTHQ